MMKRVIYISTILIVAFTWWTSPVHAKQPRAYLLGGRYTNMSGNQWHLDHNGLRSGTLGYVHNLFGVYVDGGYSCLFSDVPNTHYQPGGYGIGGGICYEHQRGMWKLQLGVGMRYQNVSNTIDDMQLYDYSVSDARGYDYTLRYDFRHRVDSAWTLHAQVPLLLGVGIKGWYCLTGFKLNCSIKGASYVHCLGSTSGTYNQFLGQMWEMDNHGFRKDVDIRRQGDQLEFNTDVLYSFETGYEWGDYAKKGVKYRRSVKPGERVEYRFRVAAFVDYGLVNICPQQHNNMVYIPEDYKWDFARYDMNHVFSTSTAAPYSVHNFYAGIKLTAMIGFYDYKRCILCSEFESEGTMNTRGNKGRR